MIYSCVYGKGWAIYNATKPRGVFVSVGETKIERFSFGAEAKEHIGVPVYIFRLKNENRRESALH